MEPTPIEAVGLAAAPRARDYVRVAGPDAEDFLQRMLSNDVTRAPCDALLLTPKGRIVAPVRVMRRAGDDFLLLTEPGLGDALRTTLLRARFAAKCEIEPESHTSVLVWKGDFTHAEEQLDTDIELTAGKEELERARIEAGVPAWGMELDESILPAEAGLDETHISFTKGCYPGQEPVARLHYRGHPNRGLRLLRIDAEELPAFDEELVYEGKTVGRITSAARRPDGTIVALGYVRREVPAGAVLAAGAAKACSLD
jgi:folate-binding protein YgfZ